MNLFLVENDKTVDSLEKLSSYRAGRDVVICFNYLVYLRLKSVCGNHRFLFIEEMFTQNDYKALHSISDHFALNWYRMSGKDHSVYMGISYGEMVRVTFSRTYMITILLKYGELINKAVKKWPEAEKVFFDFSVEDNSFCLYGDDKGRFFNKKRLVEEACKQLGRICVSIVPDTVIPSRYIAFKHAHGNKTFVRIIKDTIKGSLIKINALIDTRSKPSGNIYFFSYFNIRSILDHMKEGFIASGSDSSILKLRRFLNIRFLEFNDVKYKLNYDEKSFFQSLQKKYMSKEALAYFGNYFMFNGINYGFLYIPAIRDLVLNTIPGLVMYVCKVQKAIKQFGISKIIIFEEIEERFQAVIAASKSVGVTSVWIDHGIQGYNEAQKVCDRGRSDQIICSGDYFPEYYRSKGQDAGKSRYVALGNPCLDSYPSDNAKQIKSIKNIMFLSFEDGFYGRLDRFVYQEKYYDEIFSIFKELNSRNIKVYFKPHPGSRKVYFDYLFDFFKVDPSWLVYVESAPFSKIVYDMDLVVCNMTSCFYEAQAAGIPTVFFEPHYNPDALLPPLNGINGEEVLRVSTGKDLLDLIKENQKNAGNINQFLKKFLEKHAERYMGRLDGMAGKRIVDYLTKD